MRRIEDCFPIDDSQGFRFGERCHCGELGIVVPLDREADGTIRVAFYAPGKIVSHTTTTVEPGSLSPVRLATA
jgi:hypothetical protein